MAKAGARGATELGVFHLPGRYLLARYWHGKCV